MADAVSSRTGDWTLQVVAGGGLGGSGDGSGWGVRGLGEEKKGLVHLCGRIAMTYGMLLTILKARLCRNKVELASNALTHGRPNASHFMWSSPPSRL